MQIAHFGSTWPCSMQPLRGRPESFHGVVEFEPRLNSPAFAVFDASLFAIIA